MATNVILILVQMNDNIDVTFHLLETYFANTCWCI